MERLKFRAGLATQFVDQHAPSLLKCLQGLGAPSASLQGTDQQRVRMLAQWFFGGQLPGVADYHRVPAQLQPGLDPKFAGLEP